MIAQTITVNAIFGHMRMVETQRWEGDSLVLGGYCVVLDRNAIEVSRTKQHDYLCGHI